MQSKILKLIVMMIISGFCFQLSFGGQVIYNAKNEKILLKDDGTWEYFDLMNVSDVELEDADLIGRYKGEIKDGKAHGYGLAEGIDVYEGEFINGKIHGTGKYIWRQKEFYGDIYEGEFISGEMHGKGKLTFSNGNIYYGDWKNGLMDGHGKFYFVNGTVYEGEMENNFFEGNGHIIGANGRIYKDEFHEGIPENIKSYKKFLQKTLTSENKDGKDLKQVLENIRKNIQSLIVNNVNLMNEYKVLSYEDKVDLERARKKVLVLELSNEFLEELLVIYNDYEIYVNSFN